MLSQDSSLFIIKLLRLVGLPYSKLCVSYTGSLSQTKHTPIRSPRMSNDLQTMEGL